MGLITKLRFSDQAPLVLLKAPQDCKALFNELTTMVSLAGKPVSQVMLFAENKKVLDAMYDKVIAKLTDNAVFWIAHPRQTSAIITDITRDSGWDIMLPSGYHIVSSAAINDDWTAKRIAKKKADDQYISSVPMEERKVEGIDYVNRTVTLPADALAAMKPYKGLADFFYSMAFTHKREYIESIADAKKPETRQKRIEKMIAMVQKLQEEKNKKKK